jgi:hypothetical protein
VSAARTRGDRVRAAGAAAGHAIAAGAVVEASWIGPADQQALQKLAPGTIPPWSSLSMALGHLVAGAAMITILCAAGRQPG